MNMIPSVRSLVILLALASLPFCLPGCGTSPAPRLYTLSSLPVPAATESRKEIKPPVVVGIGPIEIPDYLDRVQIVTRTARNRLSISEFDQWGGSFREDVSRVLLENIGALLQPSGAVAISWRSYVPCTVRVLVGILRLDAVEGENVVLRARWALVAKGTQKTEVFKETALTVPIKGKEMQDAVAAMSIALEGLSRDIASSLMKDFPAR